MATALPRIDAVFTLGELAQATGATLHGPPTLHVGGVSTDSRAIHAGALFVALVGERFDGHDHLAGAFENGARAAVVARGRAFDLSKPALEVDDTLRALGAIARFHGERVRAASGARVVAIGGAVGKTTTKELTAAALQAAFGPTHATRGNLNNLVGAPLTLLGFAPSHRAAVIECGTNAPGEIARIGEIVRPDVALVMNADVTHTEGLGSIEGVAKEEGSLFGYATRAVVGNADEALSRAEMSRAKEGVARWLFGTSPEAHARLVSRVPVDGGRARLTIEVSPALCEGAGRLTVDTLLLGEAAATNVTAALCATAAAGATAEQLRAAAEAIGDVRPVAGRLVFRALASGVNVLDDTYNASPRAVRAAVAAAVEVALARRWRLVVALGDMLELGALSEGEHAAAGELVARSGAAAFVATGPEMLHAARAVSSSGGRVAVLTARDAVEAGARLRELVKPGDLVLVKGSRGMRMERCIDALAEVSP